MIKFVSFDMISFESATNISEAEWDQIFNLSHQLLINCRDEEDLYPCPWDSIFSIEDGDLILEGGASSGGFGSCVVKVPKKSGLKIYKIILELFDCEESDVKFVSELLKSHGIEFKMKLNSNYDGKNLDKVLNKKVFGKEIHSLPYIPEILNFLNSRYPSEIEEMLNAMKSEDAHSNKLFNDLEEEELNISIGEYTFEILQDIAEAFVADSK